MMFIFNFKDDIEKIIESINEKENALKQVKEDVLPLGQFPPRRGSLKHIILQNKKF